MRILVLLLLACLRAYGATLNSDGSSSDTQTQVNSASDGDIVQLPAGAFTWSSAVTVSGKGIKIQGAGGGKMVGTSTSTVSVGGSGTKSFTTQAGIGLVAGQPVTAYVKNRDLATSATYIQGTVSSYSGTSLDITASASGGPSGQSYSYWYITTNAATIITNNVSGSYLFDVTEDTTHNTTIANIRMYEGTADNAHLRWQYTSGGQVGIVSNCWFSSQGGLLRSIEWNSNRGLIHSSLFDEGFCNSVDEGIVFKPLGLTTAWTTATLWGSADTGGNSRAYVENCYFATIAYSSMDIDDNAIVTFRHNTFDNSGTGSHGKDTSPYGMVSAEAYKNIFIFQDMGTNTVNMNWTIYQRGGSWVICSNTIPDITSSAWGAKPENVATLFSIRRNTSYNCTSYPCSHQIGRGYITAENDLVPCYYWENTGSANANITTAVDYQPDEQMGGRTMEPDYWQENRDYYYSARPGWTPYTFPHPLALMSESGGGGSSSTTGTTVLIGGSRIIIGGNAILR